MNHRQARFRGREGRTGLTCRRLPRFEMLEPRRFLAGSITGQGQIERIAGNPSLGYKSLYEWDLFLSPSDESVIGPSRRLGAPPGQLPRGDGFYEIDNLPAGTYSVLLNQPDFFASPKVVPGVSIVDGQQTQLDVNLDVDYSTYFRDGGEWTDWGPWDWYQTFIAGGTSIRGVSWVLAGAGLYRNKTAVVKILEDNGDPDVRNWRVIGTGSDNNLAADSDEWVRWTSGEVPTTRGHRYAVNIHIDGGLAIYKRDKDAQSDPFGQAFDGHGVPQELDLNITVFSDRKQMVTHTSKSSGPGAFDGGRFDNRWGQTFVATGRALASADLFAASGEDDVILTWTVREGGPGGPVIGPSKTTRGTYFASTTDLIGVSYNPHEIPLIPGNTYYIEAYSAGGFTPFAMQPWETYPDGNAFRNGSSTAIDLSLTILEYSPASVVDQHLFYNGSAFDGDDPAANAADDDAIPFGKQALLPSGTAGFANYSSFEAGLNGVMLDIQNLAQPHSLGVDDFVFRVGNSSDTSGWTAAPAPIGVSVREQAGVLGSDRVTLIWNDNDIQNSWLQVTTKANQVTGLIKDQTFHFGSAIGESGDSTSHALVNGFDFAGPRDNPTGTAGIESRYDYNRDRLVDGTDLAIARDHVTHFDNSLKLIPVLPPPAMLPLVVERSGPRRIRDGSAEPWSSTRPGQETKTSSQHSETSLSVSTTVPLGRRRIDTRWLEATVLAIPDLASPLSDDLVQLLAAAAV